MGRDRLMVVDDEHLNLLIIEEFLANEAVDLDTFTDSEAAWAHLQGHADGYALVVLDRMMPALDGLDFLKRMKADHRFSDIPVVMQTAAAEPDQVREGLEAGAYYYLTKPYEPDALISIVRAALNDCKGRETLRHTAARFEEAHKLLVTAEYRFNTLEEIANLVPVLAGMCPTPDVAAAGLSDLMVNAVEHGNLAISYKEKAQLKWDGGWEKEVGRRLKLPEYAARYATVRFDRQPESISFTITDMGEGFDWQKYLDFDPERAFDPNGRGIAMARAMIFNDLRYEGKGNVVVATVTLTG